MCVFVTSSQQDTLTGFANTQQCQPDTAQLPDAVMPQQHGN